MDNSEFTDSILLWLSAVLKRNKPELSRSCRASFKNLGQKFGTKIWDNIWDGNLGQTDMTRYRVALQLKRNIRTI